MSLDHQANLNEKDLALVEKLQDIGFSQNDSKVYLTLIKIGFSKPSEISKVSKVDRARVYDSLRRLEKKGIVSEEPVERAPRYKAVAPSVVFSKYRNGLKENVIISKQVQKVCEEYFTDLVEPHPFMIHDSKNIKDKIFELLESAQETFEILLTINYSKSKRNLRKFVTAILEKKAAFPDIKIKVGFSINDYDKEQKDHLRSLFKAGIEIFDWREGLKANIMPFGLVLTEKDYFQTFLNHVSLKPDYGFGFIIQNASKFQIMGFKTLVEWIFAQQSKRIAFVVKE